MTEYGRGYGSEPWHPEDPLYGDQGSYGGQAQQPQWDGQQSVPYPQQQHQGGHGSQGGHGGWDGSQGGQLPYDPYDPYAQQAPADPYGGAGRPAYGNGPQDPYQAQDPYHAPDPYRQQAAAHPQHQQVPHQQQYPPQQYAAQEYAPQQYEQHAGAPYEQHVEAPYEEAAGDDWRAEPEPRRKPEPEHSFFADDREDDDYDDEPDERGGRERRGKGKKEKKRRSKATCLVAALVFAGAVGAVGYFGYDFFMAHFGSAPDYAGEGSGAVEVDIPDGSLISDMGQILAKKGVIKSAGAFTQAASADDKKSRSLQPGTYSLRMHMSAAAAMDLMLDPKSRNGLTVREGLRARAVYSLIDQKLKLKAGTTKKDALSHLKELGLPSWANDSPQIKDPLEGFLFPSTYSVGGNTKPVDVLKQMVGRATQAYGKYDLEAEARKFHLKSPLQVITVASLTQAEGMTHDDFRKMAAVVYNRLSPSNTDTNQKLQFDSTYNYLTNQSKANIGSHEINNAKDPYNTYLYRGLPPGPIGNPGVEALKATVNPDTTKRWLYFVSIDDKKTDFATTFAEHEKLVAARKKWQQEHHPSGN
ncbi:endolytic transglycosylase MltG [Streptomyces gilvosporeus]|uniref:Endolytic murein transglycosylase n=1 Tax=Streptomyces gilvosporeus TaxID=553510 RepID=A0A1V0TN94_9ACTN|nr:endolytic transglycosylase MltG [Streptomyces gilvosporeus]ARF54399.1 aminodeoxychorismate lyase [Streptomyces gilvosporeus]